MVGQWRQLGSRFAMSATILAVMVSFGVRGWVELLPRSSANFAARALVTLSNGIVNMFVVPWLEGRRPAIAPAWAVSYLTASAWYVYPDSPRRLEGGYRLHPQFKRQFSGFRAFVC